MSEINLRYIKSILKFLIKRMTEYKADFYSSFIVEIIVLFSIILIFFIVKYNFTNISWSVKDFIIYIILGEIILNFSEAFSFKMEHLNYYIKHGEINNELILPKSSLFIFLTKELSVSSVTMLLIELIFFIILLILGFITIKNWLFLIFLLFLCIIFEIFIFIFFNSFELRIIGISEITKYIVNSVDYIFERYPPILFQNFKYRFIFYFSVFFIIGTILIPVTQGNLSNQIIKRIIFFIITTIIIVILAITSWNYNLKYYEAYS